MSRTRYRRRSKFAEFEILYGHGISREGELIDIGVLHNIVDKAGSWYSYNGERIGQGKENARQYLIDHPQIAEELDRKLRALLLPKLELPAAGAAEPEAAAAKG